MSSKPVADFAAGLPAGARGAGRAAAFAVVVAAAARTTAHAFAAAEQLHLLGDDLGGVVVLAFLVLPLAGLQAALDVHRAALLQVFTGDLGQAVVEHHAVPFGLFLLFAAVRFFQLRVVATLTLQTAEPLGV